MNDFEAYRTLAYRPDPSHRVQVWAMAVCAVLGGARPRSVEQAAAIADEVVAKLDARAAAGSFDVDEPERR